MYLNIIFHHKQEVVCLFLLLSDTKVCDLEQHGEHIIGNGSLEKQSIIGYDFMSDELK